MVKTIARTLKPTGGTVLEGKGLNIGYFAQQELDVLRPLENPLEHMVNMARAGCRRARAGASRTCAPSWAPSISVATWSNAAGRHHERRREGPPGAVHDRLAAPQPAAARRADQPPDLATREALAMALNEFEGTVMLVSHDRSLLRSVCDEFWLVSHGGIEPFEGDLDDYQRYLLDEAKRARESLKESLKAPEEVPAPTPAPANKKITESSRR